MDKVKLYRIFTRVYNGNIMKNKKSAETPKIENLELAATLADIRKRFGDGAIMQFGKDKIEPIEVVPTGALSLDIALCVCGVPPGPVI